MPRASTLRLAWLLSLALPLLLLAGCADCGGGGGDGGPDGGETADDDAGDQCSFIGGDCTANDDCCGALVCGATGVCGDAPTCEDNDTFAGTPAAPADLEALGDNTPLACTGFPFLDVFSIEATAGDILRIRMETVGLTPNTAVEQGQSDIDLYLLNGPPTGVTNQNGGNSVAGPVVEAAATELSTEFLLYEVPTTGTYYLAVTVWSGPDAEYSLDFSVGVACDFDADCTGDTDYCRVSVDEDAFVVIQECATWTAPGCGAGDDEGGGDVHGNSGAQSLTPSLSGLICPADIDVFTFEKALTERAVITLSSDDLPATDAIVGTLVDAEGAIFDVFVLEADPGTIDYGVAVGAPAGLYYLYLDQFGPGTAGASYDVSVDLQAACRTDADCAGGRSCGQEAFGGGPVQVCVIADDACSDNDADNSRTTATALTSAAPASAGVCMGGWDMYAIELEDPATNVDLTVTWTGTADIDLYVFAEDGTGLGAGWYGDGVERWAGVALEPQTIYAWVSVYACDFDAQGAPVPCVDQQSYSLSVELDAPTVCDQDDDCFVGGTTSNAVGTDPSSLYKCVSRTIDPGTVVDAGPDEDAGPADDAGPEGDAGSVDAGATAEPDAGTTPDVDAGPLGSVQVCVRPVEVGLFDKVGGDACYDPRDCAGNLCIDDYCSSDCTEGQTDCDATFGALDSYCFELSETPVCLQPCGDDTDCDRVWGADNNLSCTAGECVLP